MLTLSWVLLVMLSIWASLIAFLWGLKTNQFSNQNRARYLPLNDDYPMPRVTRPSKPGIEAYVLTGILAAVSLGLLAGLILSLYRMKG